MATPRARAGLVDTERLDVGGGEDRGRRRGHGEQRAPLSETVAAMELSAPHVLRAERDARTLQGGAESTDSRDGSARTTPVVLVVLQERFDAGARFGGDAGTAVEHLGDRGDGDIGEGGDLGKGRPERPVPPMSSRRP